MIDTALAKDLSARADKLLSKLRGKVVVPTRAVAPSDSVVLLTERTTPRLVRRDRFQALLHEHGLHWPDLDDVLSEIASDRRDDGAHFPIVIFIEGWFQVAFVECPPLSRGGVA